MFIDSIPITSFKPSSDDTELIFTIPSLPNIPPTGRIVVLTVQNAGSTDSRTILLLPAILGLVDVTYDGVETPAPPLPIVANQPATLRFIITSHAEEADFQITTEATTAPPVPSWQNPNLFRVLDDQKVPLPTNRIHLTKNQVKTFYIQIMPVPQDTPDKTSVNLAVLAVAGSATGGTTASFTTGQATETPDPSIKDFSALNAIIPDPTNVSSFTKPGTLQIKTGIRAIVLVNATLTVAGNYNLTFAPSATDAATQGWTIDFSNTTLPIVVSQQDLTAQGGQSSVTLRVSFTPTANATGPITIKLRIDHDVPAPNSKTIPFTLTRIP